MLFGERKYFQLQGRKSSYSRAPENGFVSEAQLPDAFEKEAWGQLSLVPCECRFVCNFSPRISVTVAMPTPGTGGRCQKERRSGICAHLVYPSSPRVGLLITLLRRGVCSLGAATQDTQVEVAAERLASRKRLADESSP